MATPKPLVWHAGKDSVRGYVDGLQMFSLYGSGTEGFWIVTNLPGLPMVQGRRHETIDDAKHAASGNLARWVDRIVEAGQQ